MKISEIALATAQNREIESHILSPKGKGLCDSDLAFNLKLFAEVHPYKAFHYIHSYISNSF